MIRTLIVDDSPLVRDILRDFLESDGSFEIIGEAENGKEGVEKAQELNPELITMDIEMPQMNGLEAIGEIKKNMDTAIVVISTYDTAKMAYEATVKGAMEFFAKDIFTSQMTEQRRTEILNTLKHITKIKKKQDVHRENRENTQIKQRRIKAVVIASSTGGPMAMSQLCATLPKDFAVPVLLVQHNTSGFDKGFVQWLAGYTQLNIYLAEEGMSPAAGNVYVGPTDKHFIIGEKGTEFDYSEPVNNQKPAADLLFKSAAELYKESLVSVVLTGMGNDGAEGTRYVKQAGGITIAQDESSSMVFGMPQAAVNTGCVDIVLPLNEIARQLVFLTKRNG